MDIWNAQVGRFLNNKYNLEYLLKKCIFSLNIGNFQGEMVEVTNDEFTYCVLVPEFIENNVQYEGYAFGVGPKSDSAGIAQRIFKSNTDIYKVLSMCIYEVSLSNMFIIQFQPF